AGKSKDLEIPCLLRWDEAFASVRVDGGVLIHSEAPPPASPWTLPASGVDPDVFNHRGTEQTGFISRYHLELRTGGKTIWRQPLDGGTVALRDELLEDITDVSAFGALRGYGVAVGSGFNAPTATLIATASSRPAPVEAGAPRVPVSRGAACDWFKDGGTCPATDGILSAPEGSPPEWYFPEESLARSALTFQLTQPTALRSILIRGFEFFRRPEYTYAAESGALDQGTLPPVTLKVEGSTDGSVWSTVAVHTVPEGRHEFWYVSTLEYIFVELPVASTDTFTRVRLSLNSTDGAEPIRGLWELSLFQR
ncbi:MAG: hypothetical protein ACT4TC_26000, partial [Myxococcaceae bacterium]